MALLNPPDILPEAMRFLVRALLALRQPHADRADLIGLIAPAGLTEAMASLGSDATDTAEAEPEDLATGGEVIADRSLDGLATLGIVEEDQHRVTLSAAAAARWKKPADVTARGMRSAVLDAVIASADPAAPFGATAGTTDLMQAIGLLHTAGLPLLPFDRLDSRPDPRPGDRDFAAWQTERCGSQRTESWPVPNREQWQSFRRWAPYLGLARIVGSGALIPDASEALIQRLPDLTPGEYPIRDFISRCAQAVPILDGGVLRSGFGTPAQDDASVLSGGLSVTLLQLQADGFIDMPRPQSDAGHDDRILRVGSERPADRRVTTVIWHATSHRRGDR
jgi:hypothetical protein